eukprot:5976304-Prymnesium_polylepis.1
MRDSGRLTRNANGTRNPVGGMRANNPLGTRPLRRLSDDSRPLVSGSGTRVSSGGTASDATT